MIFPYLERKVSLADTIASPEAQHNMVTARRRVDKHKARSSFQGGFFYISTGDYCTCTPHLSQHVSSQHFSGAHILVLYSLLYLSLVLSVEVILNQNNCYPNNVRIKKKIIVSNWNIRQWN